MIASLLFGIVFSAFTLVFFVIFCVAFVVTAPFDKNRTVMHRLSWVWTHAYFFFVPTWRVEVEGLENVDRRQTYVVVVNHRSMIDIITMYVLPLEFKWVAKKEVYRWPIIGWVMHMHGDVGIERGSAAGAKKMMADGERWLSRGVSLIVFPEGSRGKTSGVGRFREGAFALAKHAGVAVLPCVMAGTDTGLKVWKLNLRNVYRVRVLEPVSAEEVARTDVKELAHRVQEWVAAEYGEIKIK